MIEKPIACELLTSGWCPNSCEYCYIPKSPALKSVHHRIIKDLESGEYIDRMVKFYGGNLTYLGFWGTEPLLTTSLLTPFFPRLFEVFPKLEYINISTAMLSSESLVEFIKEVAKYKVRLGIQISLDGPSFITDKNRFRGAAEVMERNFLDTLPRVQDINLNLNFHWKSTLTLANITEMIENPTRIDECIRYFKSLYDKFSCLNRNTNISLQSDKFFPSIAVPYRYSSRDGRQFAEFLKMLRWKGGESAYSGRLRRIIDSWEKLGRKEIFTCSGGRTCFGIADHLYICHRLFYFNDDDYVNDILKDGAYEWDVSTFNRDTVNLMRRYFIADLNDKDKLYQFRYTLRSYHDFWKMEVGYVVALLRELALVDQVSPIYLHNDELAELFAIYVETAFSCPSENILNTGSIHLNPLSVVRLLGNGAFEEILESVRK